MNGPHLEPTTVISLITNGASETLCSPAMVLFSTNVPRGRTALIANCSPDSDPVASMTISNGLGFQSFNSIVLMPNRLNQFELVRMFSHQGDVSAGKPENLSAQETQFAIP